MITKTLLIVATALCVGWAQRARASADPNYYGVRTAVAAKRFRVSGLVTPTRSKTGSRTALPSAGVLGLTCQPSRPSPADELSSCKGDRIVEFDALRQQLQRRAEVVLGDSDHVGVQRVSEDRQPQRCRCAPVAGGCVRCVVSADTDRPVPTVPPASRHSAHQAHKPPATGRGA